MAQIKSRTITRQAIVQRKGHKIRMKESNHWEIVQAYSYNENGIGALLDKNVQLILVRLTIAPF